MRRPKKRRRTTVGDVIWRIIFLIALAVFLFCAYRLLTIYLEYKKGTDEYSSLENQYVSQEMIHGTGEIETDEEGLPITGYKKVSEEEPETEPETETELVEDEEGRMIVKSYPVLKNPIDFKSLKEVNEDIIGWIRVNALDISYPIAQAGDNDFYLHRTFEKEDNFAGCIFVDFHNKSDFSDQNTIVYGHNMKNGSMFGKLKDFYEEGVYESAPYFWIYTPDKIYKYDIFSCSQVGATSNTYQFRFATDEDFEAYVQEAFAKSVVDSGKVQVKPGDKLVTLSTCTGDESTRFVVQGKLAKVYKSAK